MNTEDKQKTMLADDLLVYIKNKHTQEECIGFIDGYNSALTKLKSLTIPVVVAELPSVKSKEFQRWTQSKGYEPAFNGLWYEKNNQTYNTEILHKAFTNETEFGW